MESLVLANIKHRPTRTLVTAAGVSIGTVLILLFVGLSQGMLKERGERDTNMAAEIIVRPAGSFTASVSANVLSLPVEHADKVAQLPGVQSVAPVGQYLQTSESGVGFRAIDAINFDTYSNTTGIRLVSGKTPANDEEVVVDEEYIRSNKVKIGDEITAMDRKFRIAGIYSPQVGARIKVRLPMLQSMLGADKYCTMLLVRCDNSADQERIAEAISKALPDTQIILTRDLPRLYSEGIPALNVFLRVLIGLAIFISSLVILLAMYTAITERTREIGVLKSLGASRTFIIWAIEKEAIVIGVLGVIAGYAVALGVRFLLVNYTTLRFIEFQPVWLLITAVVGILGALIGALYPAYLAARQDPVEALSYE